LDDRTQVLPAARRSNAEARSNFLLLFTPHLTLLNTLKKTKFRKNCVFEFLIALRWTPKKRNLP
jgi:hypothetical protein